MNRTLASRIAKLEAARPSRPFVLSARTPEEADTLIARHRGGGTVIVAPPVADSVDAWLAGGIADEPQP
jgi:hypothetical protein